MGTPLTHVLSLPPGYNYNQIFRVIQYGKCESGPYAQNDLWFVKVGRGRGGEYLDRVGKHLNADGFDSWEHGGPEQDHTFLVSESLATPRAIEVFRRNVEKWSEVAHVVFVGDWDVRNERLWEESPVYEHELPDGTNILFGYSPTQSEAYPERELWYVSLPGPHTFIVDRECIHSDFMNHVGSDFRRWIPICWSHMEQEDYINNHVHTIALDAPWVPDPNFVQEMDEIQGRKPKNESAWWERQLFPGSRRTEEWKRS